MITAPRPASLGAILRAVALAAGLAPAAGCSTFERDWATLDAAPARERAAASRWRGTWASAVSGHAGGLRCILTETGPGALRARYRATYAGVLSFEYAVPMTVRRDGGAGDAGDGGGTVGFSGEADLGWLAGGRYEYRGTIVGDRFEATYRCDRDRGVFRMRRVAGDGAEPGPDAGAEPEPEPEPESGPAVSSGGRGAREEPS